MPREHDRARDQLRAVETAEIAAAEKHALAGPQAQHRRHVERRHQRQRAIAGDVAAGLQHQPAGEHAQAAEHQPQRHQMRGDGTVGRRLLADQPGARLAQAQVEGDRQHQRRRHDVAVEAELADAKAARQQQEHREVGGAHHQPGEQHPQRIDAASPACIGAARRRPFGADLDAHARIGLGQQPVGRRHDRAARGCRRRSGRPRPWPPARRSARSGTPSSRSVCGTPSSARRARIQSRKPAKPPSMPSQAARRSILGSIACG